MSEHATGAIYEGPNRSAGEDAILGRIHQAMAQCEHRPEIDIEQTRLRAIIEGIRPPSSLDIALIADACKVSSWWLITGEDNLPSPERPMAEEKPCSRCQQIKPLTEFNKSKNGTRSDCKKCYSALRSKRYRLYAFIREGK